MIKPNRLGKISCLYGVPAFVLCSLAMHSQHYRVNDSARPLLSPVMNELLSHLSYLNGLFFTRKTYSEPTMLPFGFGHLFESEAITVFFVIGSLCSLTALYFALNAARKNEFSIWYANGAFASVVALFLTNKYLGSLTALTTITAIIKMRDMKKKP